MNFSIFRYNPEQDEKPYMQDFEIDSGANRSDASGRHSAHQGFRMILSPSENPAAKGCAALTR